MCASGSGVDEPFHTSLLPASFIKFPESYTVTILKRNPVREPKSGVLHYELSCLEGGGNRSPLGVVWCRLKGCGWESRHWGDLISFVINLTEVNSQVALVVKNPPAKAEDVGDVGSIPGSGRCAGEGNGNPLQCSCLEKSHGQKSLAGYSPWGSQRGD